MEGQGCGAGPSTEAQRRPCLTLSVSVLVTATIAFLAYAAFVPAPDLALGPLHEWRRFHDGDGEGVADGAKARPTTLSHIVFSIASSAQTWDQRRGFVELWWRPGQMRGHVWLDREPVHPWPAATSPPYRVSGLWAPQPGRRPYMSRMARILLDSFLAVAADTANGTAAAAGGEARWFVKGDDDTVFFPDNLVAVLQKYNHEEMYYIGAQSESVQEDEALSFGQAFGGGGIALSYPAAAALAGAMDGGCLDRYKMLRHSDERIHACLAELGVPLTREPGFHQVDITGDAYGMLAAHPVVPLVSLHHLDHIKPITPRGKTALDAVTLLFRASQLDPARTLQQSFCYHHGPGYNLSVSVAWGYTAQVYPWGVPAVELEVPLQTFKTWRGPLQTFVFNTRPLNPHDACARPAIFFLSELRNETGGATVTEYARHAVEPEECDKPGFRASSAVRSVRVFAPKMRPSDWKRAPRRHCCKVERTTQGSVLEVQIRRCGGGELVTP
ncbi:hypothetical protein ACP4OV_002536 [Aristida adscensionis]